MNDLSIVILNYNGRTHLEKFLPDVVEHSSGAHIVVADNASQDDSVAFIRQEFPQVEVIELPVNMGYSGGYDYVLRKIKAEFFCLLNSDVQVSSGWIDPIMQLFDAHKDVAAIQPKILAYNQPEMFEYAGAGGGFIDKYGFPFCRGRLFWTFETDTGQYDDTCEIFWASGACLFIRSDVFLEAGGLDEDFFAHMEEIDLCWRLWGMGWRIMYTGRSNVYHVGGGTLNKLSPRKTYLNFRNGLSLIYKNMPHQILENRLFIRTLMDIISIFRFLVIFQWDHAWAVTRAHWDFWTRLKYQREKRRSVQALMRINKIKSIYDKSLVWQYFIKGKRKFSKLSGASGLCSQ